MAEDYPAEQAVAGQMDMSHELANQAAAEAVAAAVARATATERERERDDPSSSTQSPHTHQHHDLPQPGQGPPPPPAYQRSRAPSSGPSLPFHLGPPHRQAPDSPLSNGQQLQILRDFYARNPNPSKKDLEMLAERTGRPWNKIREYFRQRRNKLRGLSDLENMEEPGRASSWLQVTYRPGPPTAVVSQLNLFHAYKTRFDPYSAASPLLGGQELIQLACATFPGSEMARDDGDYVVRGLRDKDGAAVEAEWDRGVDAMVEPLRGATWLLGNFQHQADQSAPPTLSQTELYTAYATRFSFPEDDSGVPNDAELKDFEANMDEDDINAFLPPPAEEEEEKVNRLLNPVELIALARMTFPKCEPAVDEEGRFVIRGLERREGVEKGRQKTADMFPFALMSAPGASEPAHPFTSILKRKLALLSPEPEAAAKRRATSAGPSGIGVNIGLPMQEDGELGEEDKELLDGLKRFKDSKLGKEVRDTCVQQ